MHVTADARFALVCLLSLLGVATFAERLERSRDASVAFSRGSPPQRTQPAASDEANALRDGRPLDLNRAGVGELSLLPGIGPRMAQEIVHKRERDGPFRSLAELDAVRGIGQKTLRKIAPFVRLGSERLEHAAHAQGEIGRATEAARLRQEASAQVDAEDPAARE